MRNLRKRPVFVHPLINNLSLLLPDSPATTTVEPMETEIKVEIKQETSEETGKKKKKRNIRWATDDKLVEYHYYEPDDEERGNVRSMRESWSKTFSYSTRPIDH